MLAYRDASNRTVTLEALRQLRAAAASATPGEGALVRDCRPPRVCVVGLRSIGTTLAAVAHAAIEAHDCPVWSCTVRPVGHPFARRVQLDAALEARLRAETSRGAYFAIVDEGPGLSGSSFASTAAALEAIGVAADRIVFLPAWDPPGERLGSDDARRAWAAHPRIHVDAATLGIRPERVFGTRDGLDFSAGRWRPVLYASCADWPAVEPQHERWQVQLPREGRLLKFVGLGRFGEAARKRALMLASLGLAPEPGELRRGFLDLPFVPGTPWRPADGDPHLVGTCVARVARACPAGTSVDPDPLFDLVLTNVREFDDTVAAPLARIVEHLRAPLSDAAAAEIDGRMLPHEWIATPDGAVKVDALDHYRDHFYPGVQHPAWDLAAATVEFEWTAGHVERMLRAYERQAGDAIARGSCPSTRWPIPRSGPAISRSPDPRSPPHATPSAP